MKRECPVCESSYNMKVDENLEELENDGVNQKTVIVDEICIAVDNGIVRIYEH